MQQPSSAPATTNTAESSAASDLWLSGRWLTAVRVGWIVLAITVVALDIIALPDTYTSQLPPDALRQLERVHFSPDLYNAIAAVESLIDQLAFLGLAALLFWRKPDDRMALFASVMLLTFGGIIGGGIFDPTTGDITSSVAAIPVVRQVAQLLVVVAQASLVTFFYLFPSGRFVPRWTRWLSLLLLVCWTAVMIYPALFTGPLGSMTVVFFATALVAQVYRYRHISSPREREQTKWVVFGIVLCVLIIAVPQLILWLLPQDVQNRLYYSSAIGNLVWGGRWNLALLLIPVSIALAILRSRLWDIDVIINKALVYGSLTLLMAGIYFGLVIGLGSLVRGFAGNQGQSPVIIVISTLAIAALFQPLRHRIQRFIDRRFYRGKYDATRTLAAFGATLRAETDLGALSERLIIAVQETMQPAHTSLWLRTPAKREAGREV